MYKRKCNFSLHDVMKLLDCGRRVFSSKVLGDNPLCGLSPF